MDRTVNLILFFIRRNHNVCIYAPINVKSALGKGGANWTIGRIFDIFRKIAVKFAIPGQKCEVKFNWNSPPGKWFVVTGTKEIQIFLPSGQQDNLNALPPRAGQSDQSNPRLMLRLRPSPGRLHIDRCITHSFKVKHVVCSPSMIVLDLI